MLPTSRNLTNAERLRIARRRAGATQQEWAKGYKVSMRAYKAAESGESNDIRAPAIGELQAYEACKVLRMRKKLTLSGLAHKLKVTPWWLCLMEQGKAPVAKLLKYWTTHK